MISAFEEDFKASRVLEWGKGYCVQKAVLLEALARAAGIPSRLAFEKIRIVYLLVVSAKEEGWRQDGFFQIVQLASISVVQSYEPTLI